ncbi:PLP-dependent aminotransferase family protein [Mangrovicella endophytica]|uniref:aminotransferase-like domain-containing protein n=1 Tax=Mangrovicella endophytica TaxID=2066697 RepID=UPI000C9E5F0E|nr:PLP-dependent aminotransferase family protein [Mangrovicella endophytica]
MSGARAEGRGESLAAAVARRIRDSIEAGALPSGARLPSIRSAAVEFGVSKNTIVDAYDRLVLSGHAVSRAGSGFVVTGEDHAEPRRPKHVAEAIDIASLLGAQLHQSFAIRVGDGRPPSSWMEGSELRRHLGSYGRVMPADLEAYGSAAGFLPLRRQIAQRLTGRQIAAGEDNILLTFGANHALDLVIRAMVSPGDTVFVDDPGYYPLFAKLRLARANVVGIRRTPDGPSVEDFIAKTESERGRLFFTQSLGHNPTGGSVTLPVAHAILNAASRQRVLIIEDDPFADLPIVDDNRLARLGQLDNVVHIGTFSKTLSASLRSGFIAAREDRIAELTELKMLTTVNSSGHIERLIDRLIGDGHYDRHLKRLARRTEAAAERVRANLAKAGLEVVSGRTDGYYVYLRLPGGVDDIELAKAAAAEGIFIAPGSVFCIDKDGDLARGMRINISRADDMRFYEFLLRKLT